MQGSVLDPDFLKSLGTFDITYSWGVLHHTGDMWRALENIVIPVAEDGRLFIAIYNDQGFKSRLWKKVKRAYCRNSISRTLISTIFYPYLFLRTAASSLVSKKNLFTGYRKKRGMSIVHDWRDWLGGYPFEVATTTEIFNFYNSRGFILTRLESSCGLGNNQFVFHFQPAALKPLQISSNRSP
ncbi:class I SAM-dependent methyltransferase [Thiolapillus brandeum]|uniref:class I SAM-dependent methyltransferase n=1 Tax=Thiolapillus brandeum TaxID=1076588 RepID=UPI001CB78773|nr:class I SAM-dependent methyltransferase [Thiolapillus brandeum]